jgi:sulfite exporter TauE/SafE
VTALVITVFTASLLGSLHCAGMCGAFLAFALADGSRSGARAHVLTQLAYHGGRLCSYMLLGGLAGAAGGLVDVGSSLAGLQHAAAALAGAAMIFFGLVSILRLRGVTLQRAHAPQWMQKLSQFGYRAAMNRPPVLRALSIGLLTTLLPCGWLYAFAVTAAGTASAFTGAIVMAVFWLGTLPVLVALGAGLRSAFGSFAKRIPVISCTALVLVGLYTLVGRWELSPISLAREVHSAATHADAPPCCREAQ